MGVEWDWGETVEVICDVDFKALYLLCINNKSEKVGLYDAWRRPAWVASKAC